MGDWKKALKRHKIGDKVTITYFQTGSEKTAKITFAADQTLELLTFKKAGCKASKK
jgi:predicted metalloprotease with PDZ domain